MNGLASYRFNNSKNISLASGNVICWQVYANDSYGNLSISGEYCFAVDITFTGTDGYDLASAEDYDLIILDLMLPEMGGIEICKKLRSDKNHTPILILTARTELDNKVEGLNCGADDYLTKPFAFNELLSRIRALLRRPKNLISDKLKCADLTLDTRNFRVERSGKEVLLSKKEFSLLEYLIRNKNTVISKDKIISHVWNYDSDILPNTVEVYIGYLRNKVDKPFKNSSRLIHTIRGFGYEISDK